MTIAGDITTFSEEDIDASVLVLSEVLGISPDALDFTNLRPGSVIGDAFVYMNNYSVYHDLIRGE
jgi:hypothetical protein